MLPEILLLAQVMAVPVPAYMLPCPTEGKTAMQIALCEVGNERDALRDEVRRLRGLIGKCEAAVDRQRDFVRDERAIRESLEATYDRELRRLERTRKYNILKNWGIAIGAGAVGYAIGDD